MTEILNAHHNGFFPFFEMEAYYAPTRQEIKTCLFRVEALSWIRLGYFGNSVPKTSTAKGQFLFMYTVVTCLLMSLPFQGYLLLCFY